MASHPKDKFEINYSLKSILISEQRINESANVDLTDTKNLTTDFSGAVNLIESDFIIETSISYQFLSKEIELFYIQIINEFSILKTNQPRLLKVYQNQHFIKHLINISTHHFRGMQSILLKDSKYKSLYIPLNNNYQLQIMGEEKQKPPIPA